MQQQLIEQFIHERMYLKNVPAKTVLVPPELPCI
jgi:hypothetical protein